MSAPHPAQMSQPGPGPSSLSRVANKSSSMVQREDNIFCLSTPFDVLVPFACCFIVPERTHMVELYFGRYHGTITKPGCYCRSICVLEMRRVKTDLVTYDLKNTKVLDASGSPVVISGIVTYEIVDARRAAIDVNDPHRFVHDQAPAVLKRVVSQFPYESNDPQVASLRTDAHVVANLMCDALQQRVEVAGIRIDTFSINELSYAPEIAQAMLKRQQADALIAARRAIVKGAREIATDAVQSLGDGMTIEERSKLLSNLLVVLVGDKDVTPTLQV